MAGTPDKEIQQLPETENYDLWLAVQQKSNGVTSKLDSLGLFRYLIARFPGIGFISSDIQPNSPALVPASDSYALVGPGTYTNFKGANGAPVVIGANSLGVLKYDSKTGFWFKIEIPVNISLSAYALKTDVYSATEVIQIEVDEQNSKIQTIIENLGIYNPEPTHLPVLDNIFYTSKEGLKSDASIAMGSTQFGTDQAAAMQAILDRSQARPVLIIVDGRYSVGTTLYVGSNTHILALPGCGFILRNNVNLPLLANKNRSRSSITDENIIIEGIALNFNGKVGSTYNQVHHNANGTWTYGVNFVGVRGLTFKGCYFMNQRTFAGMLCNNEDVLIENHRQEVSPDVAASEVNYDGFKFFGYHKNVTIKNIYGSANDDFFSFCPNDAIFSTLPLPSGNPNQQIYDPYSAVGEQYSIVVDGVLFEDSHFGHRILTQDKKIDAVKVSNLRGNTDRNILVCGNLPDGINAVAVDNPADRVGHIGTLWYDNINVRVSAAGYLFGHVHISTYADELKFTNHTRTGDFNVSGHHTYLISPGSKIGKFILDGYNSTGATWNDTQTVVCYADVSEMRLQNMNISFDSRASGNSAVLQQISGTIDTLIIENVTTNNVNFLILQSPGAVINKISINGRVRKFSAGWTTNTPFPATAMPDVYLGTLVAQGVANGYVSDFNTPLITQPTLFGTMAGSSFMQSLVGMDSADGSISAFTVNPNATGYGTLTFKQTDGGQWAISARSVGDGGGLNVYYISPSGTIQLKQAYTR